ncbi:hypothetical protein HBN50_10810 [Halobacteriovorax sp. GB3]|uniref:hypothetical protein n=1 Tax=Halobacteriovorax sp. GB3 TaxID=2719615 RepID=UPI0023629A6C|nr:hypothetical protein [Halobacteriovorax sp. GB3]MDD0853593.1 hypothetical protein [Halobacteriovorax sp. GB3]
MSYPMTESKFNMWRGTIALAYIDSELTKEERSWIQDHLRKIPFSQSQWEILAKDLEEGLKLDDILPLITEPKDRAFLLNFANQLFREDGIVPIEKKTYENLEKKIMQGIDILSITNKIEKEFGDLEKERELERGKLKGLFKTLIDYFLDH